ncbi:MAG: hypothetical protein MK226_19600 [Saprospiraceae bacterium]|nr:hypothetical protein [Saprospiraceae bacterium]
MNLYLMRGGLEIKATDYTVIYSARPPSAPASALTCQSFLPVHQVQSFAAQSSLAALG